MAKPTILLEVDPFLLDSPSVSSFIHGSAFMAQKFDERFGGVSLKLTGSDSLSIMAEFRWQGSVVIQIRDSGKRNGPNLIVVSFPFHTDKPSTFCAWKNLDGIFDLAFLVILDRQLIKLNELKLDIKNREMSRRGYWDD